MLLVTFWKGDSEDEMEEAFTKFFPMQKNLLLQVQELSILSGLLNHYLYEKLYG